MSSFASSHLPFSTALLITALLVSSCSSSSDSSTGTNGLADASGESNQVGASNENLAIDEASTVEAGSTGSEAKPVNSTPNSQEPNPVVENPLAQDTTLVNFDIKVPVYVSDALQVRLVWGDQDITASWVADESWAISEAFPTNTENQLVVTFNDENGAITLGSFETTFETGMNASQLFQISADQFNTAQWDNDSDGVSNLDELIAGTNPGGDEVLQPVQASLELVQDKTFRITWQATPDALSYRVLENPDGISGFTDISGEMGANSSEFDHRVALYDRANARYIVRACNTSGCADSVEQIVSGSLERAIGYIKASDTDWYDVFGTALSLSADGDTLAVGAEAEVVYVFVRLNGNWQEQARLASPDSRFNNRFGNAVSLSADGNTLAVGAREGYGPITEDNVGATYVYTRTNGNWQQQAQIQASNAQFDDQFGFALSVSSDGETLAVGAPQEASAATGINGNQNDNSAINSGAVYMFARIEGSWQQQAYIKASSTDRIRNEFFGQAVSLSGNGKTLAVGAPTAEEVYVFTQINEVWQQQAYLQGSNTEYGDRFGIAVSLSRTGDILAVGSPEENSAATGINGNQNDNSAIDAGAVYVFTRDTGSWQQQDYLKASNTDIRDLFGYAVSLSADGNKLAIGAFFEESAATGINGNQNDNSIMSSSAINDTAAGAAYMFIRNSGSWQQQAYLKASNTGGVVEDNCFWFIGSDIIFHTGDKFGRSVSLSADGDTLAVGAPEECSGATGINGDQDDNSIPLAGAVYLY